MTFESFVSESCPYFIQRFRSGPWYQQIYKGHTGCVNAIDISKDSTLLASGGDDCSVLLWPCYESTSFAKPIKKLYGHVLNIFSIQFSCNEKHLISTGLDARINLHDIEYSNRDSNPLLTLTGHSQSVHRVCFLNDDPCCFLSAGYDKTARFWDTRIHSSQGTVKFPFRLYSVDTNRNNHWVVSGDSILEMDFRKISLNNTIESNEIEVLKNYNTNGCESSHALYNSIGNKIIATISNGYPTLFDVNCEHPNAILFNKNYESCITMKAAQFAGPNEEFIVAGSDNCNIYMWDLFENKIPLQTEPIAKRTRLNSSNTPKFEPCFINSCNILKGHRSIPNHIAYHKKLCRLFSCGVEKCVRIWDMHPFESICQNHKELTHRPFSTPSINLLLGHQDEPIEDSPEESELTLSHFDLERFKTVVYRFEESKTSWYTSLLQLHGEEDPEESNAEQILRMMQETTEILDTELLFQNSSSDELSDEDEVNINENIE